MLRYFIKYYLNVFLYCFFNHGSFTERVETKTRVLKTSYNAFCHSLFIQNPVALFKSSKAKVSRKHYTNRLNSLVLGLKEEFCGLTITQTAYLPSGVPDS